MRVVLTHPFCWPYVRRGSERFIAELAEFLTQGGHHVVTVSSKPGPKIVEHTPTGVRILHRQLWTPLLAKARITPMHAFPLGVLSSLKRLDADVVHCLGYLDAWAAARLLSRRGYRLVYQVTGPVVPHWLPRLPPDRYAVRGAIAGADVCISHSRFVAGIVRQYYGADPVVIPVPIRLERFPVKDGPAPPRPTLLCMAAFNERRKGVRVLLRAFELVKQRVPEAVLRLSGHMPAEVQREVLEPLPAAVRRDVEVLGVGTVDDLPRLYREASLTILPSMWEAYGMVLVESWASGTPVVATNHGGLGELVTDPGLGVLFDPLTDGQETTNAAGLADAMMAALALAADPATRDRCRKRAESFSWDVLGPEYVRTYER